MFEHKCAMCGTVFPKGTPGAKRYCSDCLKKRQAEAYARHRDKEREKAREKAAAKQAASATVFNKANRDYCAKCIYCGNFNEGYLCDYNLKTRMSRGCKVGVGCTKRETMDGKRRCERCGVIFAYNNREHLCADCRHKVRVENARRACEARLKK